MVPLERGEAARDLLTELGHEVAWHAYPMQHQVVPEEIADLAAWLATALPA
jgi:phospholipase/carboxylesterase